MAKTIIPKGALPPLGEMTDGALVLGTPPSSEFTITVKTPFLRRLWFLLTNPIVYLFAGKIRW